MFKNPKKSPYRKAVSLGSKKEGSMKCTGISTDALISGTTKIARKYIAYCMV
jgi:hypothetical protein